MASPKVDTERVYDVNESAPGYRVLVDRIWPRGVSKDEIDLDEWCKDLAPSDELRKWFGHDPERWKEFQRRYRRELKEKGEELSRLRGIARKRRVLLLYGANDKEHNQAVVLREVLKGR